MLGQLDSIAAISGVRPPFAALSTHAPRFMSRSHAACARLPVRAAAMWLRGGGERTAG